MIDLLVGFITGLVAVLVPAVVFVARALTHATRSLKAANGKYSEAQRLFADANVLRSDEERVAELAFAAWAHERKFELAVQEIVRLEREIKRTQRVPRLLWALAAVGVAAIVLTVLRAIG